MSDNPNPVNPANAVGRLRLKSVAGLVRQLQASAEVFDQIRVGMSELQDTVEINGVYTDEDLVALGITAATASQIVGFLVELATFLDTPAEGRPSYRALVNSLRRVEAQI